MRTANEHFEKNARQYDPTVFKMHQKEIHKTIIDTLVTSFNSQIQILRHQSHQKVQKDTT